MKKTLIISCIVVIIALIIAFIVFDRYYNSYTISDILGIDLNDITYFSNEDNILNRSENNLNREEFIEKYSNAKFKEETNFHDVKGVNEIIYSECYEFGIDGDIYTMEIFHYPIDCYMFYKGSWNGLHDNVKTYKKVL